MSLPVRCFTCNRVIGCYELKYEKMLNEGMPIKEILDKLKITSICCRRMFLGHVDLTEGLIKYPRHNFDTKIQKIN